MFDSVANISVNCGVNNVCLNAVEVKEGVDEASMGSEEVCVVEGYDFSMSLCEDKKESSPGEQVGDKGTDKELDSTTCKLGRAP